MMSASLGDRINFSYVTRENKWVNLREDGIVWLFPAFIHMEVLREACALSQGVYPMFFIRGKTKSPLTLSHTES